MNDIILIEVCGITAALSDTKTVEDGSGGTGLSIVSAKHIQHRCLTEAAGLCNTKIPILRVDPLIYLLDDQGFVNKVFIVAKHLKIFV